jgi:hypothetical protein
MVPIPASDVPTSGATQTGLSLPTTSAGNGRRTESTITSSGDHPRLLVRLEGAGRRVWTIDLPREVDKARAKAQKGNRANRTYRYQPNGIRHKKGRVSTSSRGATSISSMSPSGNVSNPAPTVRATLKAERSNLSKSDVRLYLDGVEQRRFYYSRGTGNLS